MPAPTLKEFRQRIAENCEEGLSCVFVCTYFGLAIGLQVRAAFRLQQNHSCKQVYRSDCDQYNSAFFEQCLVIVFWGPIYLFLLLELIVCCAICAVHQWADFTLGCYRMWYGEPPEISVPDVPIATEITVNEAEEVDWKGGGLAKIHL
jgi:hypothetical protein